MSDATSQEPSMEEILASIRRIISEEGEGKPAEQRAAQAAPGPVRSQTPAPQAAPPRPAPSRAAADDDVLELNQPVQPRASTPARPAAALAAHESDLMSSSAAGAAASAFAALSGGNMEEPVMQALPLGEGGRTLEEIVREMLRPLLKAWLDQNLPPLVERMVRAEIERLSRFR